MEQAKSKGRYREEEREQTEAGIRDTNCRPFFTLLLVFRQKVILEKYGESITHHRMSVVVGG